MAAEGRENSPQPLIYGELAPWFHLLTPPEDYREEAEFYAEILLQQARIPAKTVLEMGSGCGNNAFHMKAQFTMTLSDLSREMLKVSSGLNPECEHVQGDMRTMRLGRDFDGVFIQDAVSYMKTEDDLKAAMKTAFIHCRNGGVALFCPDYVKETFAEGTEHGGCDRGNRGLRYLEWTRDPDKSDTEYMVDFAFILREDEEISYRSDSARLGLFATETWLGMMMETGFTGVACRHYPHRRDEYHATPVFYGIRP